MKNISELSAGMAGEHLVCADLIVNGYSAFLSNQNSKYDVLLDVDGRMIRVQVKSTQGPRRLPRQSINTPYFWYISKCGKKGKQSYQQHDFDLYALVALDVRKIAYVFPSDTDEASITIQDKSSGKRFEDFTLDRAVKSILNNGDDCE